MRRLLPLLLLLSLSQVAAQQDGAGAHVEADLHVLHMKSGDEPWHGAISNGTLRIVRHSGHTVGAAWSHYASEPTEETVHLRDAVLSIRPVGGLALFVEGKQAHVLLRQAEGTLALPGEACIEEPTYVMRSGDSRCHDLREDVQLVVQGAAEARASGTWRAVVWNAELRIRDVAGDRWVWSGQRGDAGSMEIRNQTVGPTITQVVYLEAEGTLETERLEASLYSPLFELLSGTLVAAVDGTNETMTGPLQVSRGGDAITVRPMDIVAPAGRPAAFSPWWYAVGGLAAFVAGAIAWKLRIRAALTEDVRVRRILELLDAGRADDAERALARLHKTTVLPPADHA
ncbi:MAG TPA: hypothetical protein VFH47_04560, partial [Candidatus Thermoplasmatota archaeon]|nr:hypothetical protein [Candidatus Thermoplasmatota archaeon]